MCTIIDYSEKSFAVVGDTKPIKEQLKQLGGKFNFRLSCGAGWIFPLSAKENVKTFLDGGDVQTTTQQKETFIPCCTEEFTKLLNEGKYSERMKKYYLQSEFPYMLPSGRVLLIEKPQIETEFCFGEDGGKSYDIALDNCKLMETNQDCFIRKNLEGINEKIEALQNPTELIFKLYKKPHLGAYEFCYSKERSARLYDLFSYPEYEDPTAEDLTTCLDLYKQERTKFEKRLHTYLKKYGLTKIHTWTYWTQA